MREAVCALEVVAAERGRLGGLGLVMVGYLLWLLAGVVLLLLLVVVSSMLRRGESRRRSSHLGVCV